MKHAITLAVYLLTCAPLMAMDRPNIVLILADDFGVGDIQAHFPDNKILTPSLDRLVKEGMSFTDAHSPSAVCSPTRYGLLTGRYAWRTRLQEWVIAAYEPPLIAKGRPTIGSFLSEHGYRTACIGKWHLGWNWPGPQPSAMTEERNGQKNFRWDFTQQILDGPTQRGFDYYFGVDLPNLPPFTYIENDRVTALPSEPFQIDATEGIVLPRGFVGCPSAPDWKMQDIVPELTKRAIKYIEQASAKAEPFFLFYSMTSPHEPIVPSDLFRGKSGIAPIADFVMETDWSVGRVVEAVDKAGIAENTIVIFTADNGHSHYTGWNDLVQAGHQPSGPYRGHKGDVWEGGHRVPMVVRWPSHVAGDSSSDQLVCLTDIFATCAQLLDAELPANGAEDSFSFLRELTGHGETASLEQRKASDFRRRASLISHSNHGEFAYRRGSWKLVFRNENSNLEKARGMPTIAELYNLKQSVDESNDLAQSMPELVQELTAEFEILVQRGASREGIEASNDAPVNFRATQLRRWTK